MQIIEVNSHAHLGDNIINFIFFHKIKNYIEDNNIHIHYYCYNMYVENVLDFNCSDNIKIFGRDHEYELKGYNLWQGTIPEKERFALIVEDMLCKMFNIFLNYFNIPITVNEFLYQDNDILLRHDKLPEQLQNIDIIIVNSSPRSGQYNYNKSEWDEFIIRISKKYRIATTQYVNDDILSFHNYRLKDIAASATSAKIIIGINTGPLIPMFNEDVLKSVQNIYMFGPYGTWKNNQVIMLSNLNELEIPLSLNSS
jgi:hypothetical protein